MNIVSAFLIRQAGTLVGLADSVGQGLKAAREALDPSLYIRTRFLHVGSSYIPSGLNVYSDQVMVYIKDLTSEAEIITVEGNDYYSNGVSLIINDVAGLMMCWSYSQDWTDSGSDVKRLTAPNGASGFTWGTLLWVNQSTQHQQTITASVRLYDKDAHVDIGAYARYVYKTPFTTNIPIFPPGDLASTYASLVRTYYQTGAGLDDIVSFIKENAVTF